MSEKKWEQLTDHEKIEDLRRDVKTLFGVALSTADEGRSLRNELNELNAVVRLLQERQDMHIRTTP
jgi:hypothetical protein